MDWLHFSFPSPSLEAFFFSFSPTNSADEFQAPYFYAGGSEEGGRLWAFF